MVGDGTHDLSTPFQRGRQLARLSTVLALLRPPRHGQRAGQAPGRVSLSLQLSHTDRNRGAVRSPRPDEHREYPCCRPTTRPQPLVLCHARTACSFCLYG